MTDNNENGRLRDERIIHLNEDVKENKRDIQNIKADLINLRIQFARLSERVALFQVAQGIFTIIATAIGAYVAQALK